MSDEHDAVKRALALLRQEEQRITAGAIADLSPVYSRTIVKEYADALGASTPSDRVPFFDFSMRAGGARRSQSDASSYVYCWCDAQDNVFYVGKGYGNRAWAEDGHDYALRYAKHFLGGHYSVHILCDQLRDDKAFEIEEGLIRRFGNAFANWVNTCLDEHLPLSVLEARASQAKTHPRQGELRVELQRLVRVYAPGESRIEQLRKFITELRVLEKANEERERSDAIEFAHISLLHRMRLEIKEPRMNAVLGDAVSRLVSELWKLHRYREVVAAVDEFRESNQSHFMDTPGGIRMSSRDKALIAKREDADRRIKGNSD
jgi:hypothetical protein